MQFAPQVGDVDNNLNRADSVLSKASPDDLDFLDLLVLPELAFTGYNFKSLQQISPFLEPSGSGVSSLWARTTALKYNTTVVVGYPEKVDVAQRWPTSPEYYNSAIVVNGEGETIANYRKSSLYMVDETWALEGQGFFGGYLPGLGHTAIGICMDINPYKFEAPWNDFEFGYHVARVQADLVIVTMAWLTREDARLYSRMPAEPDMETLTYWVQRLEPVIRAETGREVIVIFCNRTGFEDDVVYAGTSAVIGIKDGEVNVYGLLGRGVKDLLIVDTDAPPIAKLIHRPDGESREVEGQKTSGSSPASNDGRAPRLPQRKEGTKSSQSTSEERSGSSPTGPVARTRRAKPPSPKITIPERRKYTTTTGGVIEESPTVPTPTAPSPTPLSVRPKISTLGSKQGNDHVSTPYPHDDSTMERLTPDHLSIIGGNLHVPNEHGISDATSEDNDRLSEKYFFRPPQTLIATPRDPWAMFAPVSPSFKGSLIRYSGSERETRKIPSVEDRLSPGQSEFSSGTSIRSSRSGRTNGSKLSGHASTKSEATKAEGPAPPRPSSPKSRNASRTGRPLNRRDSEIEQPDLTGMVQRLEAISRRTESPMNRHYDYEEADRQGRPRTPRSRNASRTGRPLDTDQIVDERMFNLSRTSIPIAASPGVLAGGIDRPASDIFRRMNQRLLKNGDARPTSRAEQSSAPMSGSIFGHPRSQSVNAAQPANADAIIPHVEPDESRTLVWSEISKIVGEVMERPISRSASRGRQPLIRGSSSSVGPNSRPARPESRGLPSASLGHQRFGSREGRGPRDNTPASQTMSPMSQMNGTPGSVVPYHPDEIVAEIIFHAPGCPTHSHSHRNTPTQSHVGTPSQVNQPSAQQWNNPRPRQMSNSRLNQRINSASNHRGSSSPNRWPVTSPPPTGDVEEMEISIFKAPTPLVASDRGESTDFCPPMSGSSIHTIGSPNGSPATPSPRVFEPTTPKAMTLNSDFGTILSAVSDPVNTGTIDSLKSLGNQLVSDIGLDRPKSAVW